MKAQETQYDVEVKYHHGLTSWSLWSKIEGIDAAMREYDRLMEKTKHPLCIFDDVRVIEVVSIKRIIK